MPLITAVTTHKKKAGCLTLSDDRQLLCWAPGSSPSATPSLSINVADITNLQQTPAGKPQVALKVFIRDESHVFSFTHPTDARKDQEAVTDALGSAIANKKAGLTAAQLSTPAASAPDNTAQPAALAISKAVSSTNATDEVWYDDNKLKSDVDLQRSLLESDVTLKERFNQSLREKPESVSVSQFTGQFWNARLHLLRAHAIENAQKQGEYNVLPEIKFVRKPAEKPGEPDIKQLQITKEQIKLIFKQYPVVLDAFNQNCPPLNAVAFWTRFFGSRLLKKLKGERITQQDPPDPLLDRYLERREDGSTTSARIPHFIDLEGNEQNHSQRLGNRPDEDMRPSSKEKVPILRVLNNLSEKMLSHVAPEDGEAHAPIGLDEETFEQLRLRDLASEEGDNRIFLNVKEQERYVTAHRTDLSAEAQLYANQDPAEVLSSLRTDFRPLNLGSDKYGTLRLGDALGFDANDDSDSGDDSTPQKSKSRRLGSHAALTSASQTIMTSIQQQHQDGTSSVGANQLNGLSQSVFDTLTMTHNTTIEFLHYFWTLFLSGDGSRTAELAQLVSTLDRSLDRIHAVAEAAAAEREKKVDALKRQVLDYEQRTKRKRHVDYDEAIPGGKRAVDVMVRSIVTAIGHATLVYRRALEEQSKDQTPA